MNFQACDRRMKYPSCPPCYMYGTCPFMRQPMQGGYGQMMPNPYMGGGMYGNPGMPMYGNPMYGMPTPKGMGGTDALVEDVEDE